MVQFFLEDVLYDVSQLASVPDWLSSVADDQDQRIAQLNYILCSDEYLLNINRQYLEHNYYTDIITFDQRDHPETTDIEGDLFISLDRVADNAATNKVSTFHELCRVVVHGFLHLIGYSDSDAESKNQMRCLENKYLLLLERIAE